MKRIVICCTFIVLPFLCCNYSSAQTAIKYSFEPAVQHFVVPPGVSTITLTIAGAKGAGALGGKGASFTGICSVVENHILSIVVGQMGLAVADTGIHSGGGGGGASWLYDSNSVLYNPDGTMGLLAIAAGGGGAASGVSDYTPHPGWRYYSGLDAGIDFSTNAATVDSSCDSGGTGGNGGSISTNIFNAGGGAGWLSNGGGACISGMDEANHFNLAGSNCNYTIRGGFGGGGGGTIFNGAGTHSTWGGGGGGYNGGGGGDGGGGGGSYLNGTLVGAATASDTGNGFVTISYIPPSSQIIAIYPNPNSGVFTVNGIRQEQIIELYNCLGQKLQILQANNTFMQVDLTNQPNGFYLYRVVKEDGSIIKSGKIVIER